MFMTRCAFIFPGQGSQEVGMGRDFAEHFPLARDLFAKADDILGFSISTICFAGPEEKLRLTKHTQPALLIVSTIAHSLLGREPAMACGHSLGEYSALVAAGSLAFEDAVRLVHLRGQYMQEAVPIGVGAMAAVLGAGYEAIENALARVQCGTVSVANWNSQEQVVIAGHKEAVEEALRIIAPPRSVMLPVSAPFHTSLMKSAEERLSEDLDRTKFCNLNFPVITNVDARMIRSGEEARDALKRQVSRPVLWYKAMEMLRQAEVRTVVELGPGKVLSGLAKRISRNWLHPLSILNVENGETLGKSRAALAADV